MALSPTCKVVFSPG